MKELVGFCNACQKEVYCIMGFFQGEINSNGDIYCFTCYEELKKESDKK